eukprot:TRINITY_DN6780_c0_g2_i4.p2 TRINITY_DN6780_c0_g2~~TRINITY_DN6780_c0_g2_i4.p2  ORF type:complete len:394 (-),score=106.76 TRINITY_DN6780_c0_g2_i4:2936-4117(-)
MCIRDRYQRRVHGDRLMLRSFFNAQLTTRRLVTQPLAYKSRAKSRRERIKHYESRPDLFQKTPLIKPPDFYRPDLVFPYNVRIRYRYLFKPKKSLLLKPVSDFLNFKNMTGNEILLNLENAQHFRPSELAGALVELGKRPGADAVDWNGHEWIQNVVEIVKKDSAQYRPRVVSALALALHRLRINDEELWKRLDAAATKGVHILKPLGFASVAIAMLEPPSRASPTLRARLQQIAPFAVPKLSPPHFAHVFQLFEDNQLINEELFEDFFLMSVWRRNTFYGPKYYPSLIRTLLQRKFWDDTRWWQEEFLPTIEDLYERVDDEEVGKDLAAALIELHQANPKIIVAPYLEQLAKRTLFVQTRMKTAKANTLWAIVKADLEYYTKKESERISASR